LFTPIAPAFSIQRAVVAQQTIDRVTFSKQGHGQSKVRQCVRRGHVHLGEELVATALIHFSTFLLFTFRGDAMRTRLLELRDQFEGMTFDTVDAEGKRKQIIALLNAIVSRMDEKKRVRSLAPLNQYLGG
jgi:hypothetical protein